LLEASWEWEALGIASQLEGESMLPGGQARHDPRSYPRAVTRGGTSLGRSQIEIVRATLPNSVERSSSVSMRFPRQRNVRCKNNRKSVAYKVVEREDSKCPAKDLKEQDIRSFRSSIYPHRISAGWARLVGDHPTKLSAPDAMRGQPLRANREEPPSCKASHAAPRVSRARQPAFRWSTNGTSSSTRS
jgi:hypothetical protein